MFASKDTDRSSVQCLNNKIAKVLFSLKISAKQYWTSTKGGNYRLGSHFEPPGGFLSRVLRLHSWHVDELELNLCRFAGDVDGV